jgi:hypothetical protein
MTPKTYRPTKAERAKIWEYIALSSEGAETTEDMELWEIEEAIADALYDSWYDADYDLTREIAAWLSDEFDGKTIPEAARKAALS